MYSVSADYITAMKSPAQKVGIRGYIGNKTFTTENICSGMFSLTNQCVDNDEMLLGAAYIGELQMTVKDIDIDRYDWIGKVVQPQHARYLADGTWEYVPLGIYTISEATWSADGVSIVAYDNMSKLDKKATFNATSGSAYGILTNICQSCGVELGMTEAQVEALPNGTATFGLWAENDIETFRDMISWLAQALGSFVTVDRTGRIILKSYGMTAVDTIDASSRYQGANFSDFVSRYSGISIVDIKNKKTRYYGLLEDNYLTMNLGSNPFLQYGTDSTIEYMCREILNSIAATAYVPFSVQMMGDPVYDLGDVIVHRGGLGDGDKYYVIQRYSYQIHQSYTMEGVGKNPELANAKGKTDKQIAGLLNNTNQNTFQYYFYENSEEIEVANSRTRQLLDIRFSSLKATVVMFQAEVLLEASTDDTVGRITYYTNGAEVLDYHPTETWIDGNHVLHLMWHINIGDAELTRFVATITASGGAITIPPKGVQAVISGQGLAAVGEWDGYIDIEDTFTPLHFTSMQFANNLSESLTVNQHTPSRVAKTVSFGAFSLGSMRLRGFSEELLIDKDAMSNYTHEQLTRWTHEDLANGFIHG